LTVTAYDGLLALQTMEFRQVRPGTGSIRLEIGEIDCQYSRQSSAGKQPSYLLEHISYG